MYIRRSEMSDIEDIMRIYERARNFMKETGNPNQWYKRGWPPRSLIESDIIAGKSRVCIQDDEIAAVFYYDYGVSAEPTYNVIENGAWAEDGAYGVVHRIASSGKYKGAGEFCIRYALSECGYLRIDTHPDNKVMQNLLSKLGFSYRGNIHIEEGNDLRYAYDIKIH